MPLFGVGSIGVLNLEHPKAQKNDCDNIVVAGSQTVPVIACLVSGVFLIIV